MSWEIGNRKQVPQTILQCLSPFFSASVHFSMPQTSSHHLSPQTSQLRPHTSDLFFSASIHCSVPQSIVQCLSSCVSDSVHFSVPQSICQCFSPFCRAPDYFSMPTPQTSHFTPHTSQLTRNKDRLRKVEISQLFSTLSC